MSDPAFDPSRSVETWVPNVRVAAASPAVARRATPMFLWIVAMILGGLLAVAMAFAAWIWFG